MSLSYLLHNGKNSKIKYYTVNYLRQLIPHAYFRARLEKELQKIETRPDKEYILGRVNYYNKVNESISLPTDAPMLKNLSKKGHSSVYYFDILEFTRWFAGNLHWYYEPGDINRLLPQYCITKSRPLVEDNTNSVLMKLEKNRHFTFLHDHIPFVEKMDKVIFRGKIAKKQNRFDFMQMFFDNPSFDIGIVDSNRSKYPAQWYTEKKSFYDHFKYKFIMSLEGNDVASNLKWIMSSNSLAISPRLTCETWFMEGTLIPNYHYVEIKPDFSDLEERMQYYIVHPDEAQAIIDHAHAFVKQFMDGEREKLISLLVLDKYFKITGQK